MEFGSIKKVIIEFTKKNFQSLLAMSFMIFVMIALTLTVDLFLPGSFILLFFILVLPFFISMLITNIKFKANVPFNQKDFYGQYKIGLILGCSGCFRVFRSILVAFLVYLAFVSGVFLVNIVFNFVDMSQFVEIYENLISNPNNEQYLQSLIDFIQDTKQPFVILINAVNLVGHALFVFTFIYQIIKNTLIFYIQSNFGCNKNDAINVFKGVYPKIKKTYHRVLFNILWPVLILFPLGFILGIAVTSLLDKSLLVLMYGGTLGACLLCIPLLPYIVTSSDVVFSIFSPYFLVESKETLLAALKSINLANDIPEEQKDMLRAFYVNQIKQIDLIKNSLDDTKLDDFLNHKKDDNDDKNKPS